MSNKQRTVQKHMLFIKVISVALCGGFFFSLLTIFSLYFNFVDLQIDDVARFLHVESKLIAYISVIITFMLISLIVAAIYYLILKKRNNWIPAAIFGFVLWIVFYVLIPFMTLEWNTLRMFSVETHVTTLCILIMYGTFIGYSISFHYSIYKEKVTNK